MTSTIDIVTETSITDLVTKSEKVSVSPCFVLMVPQSRQQQSIMMAERSLTAELSQVNPEQILYRVTGPRDRLRIGGLRFYLVAPGNWNNNKGYYALVCGEGVAILSSLESCGYEWRNGKLTNVADLELS